ncbi:MAG: hypothetical protein RH942_15145 [Kiloniellaceae bacterium]
MQHQNQAPLKGTFAGKTGFHDNGFVVTNADIERHIAEGKRLQAEAVAALFAGGWRRLSALFRLRRKAGAEPTHGGRLSRA